MWYACSRPLAFLLAEQVQFANKVLVNKIDLVTPEEASKIEALLRQLNPTAEILQTRSSIIDVPVLLNKPAYDEVCALLICICSTTTARSLDRPDCRCGVVSGPGGVLKHDCLG